MGINSIVGTTLYNLHGEKCHFIGEIDDNNITVYTYKWWNSYKQRWVYEAISSTSIRYFFTNGNIKLK